MIFVLSAGPACNTPYSCGTKPICAESAGKHQTNKQFSNASTPQFFTHRHTCYMLMSVDCFGLVVSIPPPFPFGRICFLVLVVRKGGESSCSGPWHLRCTLEVFHVHSYQDQFILPGWVECVFYTYLLFSLGLCFACLFVVFDLFVSPFFVFAWTVESSPLQFLALA